MGRLADFSIRFRWPIIAAWIAVLVVLSLTFPSLASQVNPDNSSFLPSNEPSRTAARLAAPFQPVTGSTALLVAAR